MNKPKTVNFSKLLKKSIKQRKINEALEKEKEKEKLPGIPPVPATQKLIKPHAKRTKLFGTGLTKKTIAKGATAFEKSQQKSFDIAQTQEALDGELMDFDIPSTLMDAKIKLDKWQKIAVAEGKRQKFFCVVGQAGVGKTTVAKFIIHSLIPTTPIIDLNLGRLESKKIVNTDQQNAAICIVAYMGKAVEQIKRALPHEFHCLCQTIHACIGYHPVDKDKREGGLYKPYFTELNKLPYKVCVIDEAGTVPVGLYNELRAALPHDCRIIFMGDLFQLPPVTGRSILGFAMAKLPTFILREFHRTAGDSSIVFNADKIIKGRMPKNNSNDFIMLEIPDAPQKAANAIQAVIQKLHKAKKFNPLIDSLIVPKNVGTIGQEALNEKLVRYFNPLKYLDGIPINPQVVITVGYEQVHYAVGDKIMLTENDNKLRLTNGMVGVITQIKPNPRFKGESVADKMLMHSSNDGEALTFDMSNLEDELSNIRATEIEKEDTDEEKEIQASHITTVQYQNRDEEVSYNSSGAYTKLKLAYAMTCHKSQGSEYPTVVVVCHSNDLRGLSREWLYTAVTRAKVRVVLLHDYRGLTQALAVQKIKGSTIEEKINFFIKLAEIGNTIEPDLHEPEAIDQQKEI